MLAGINYEALVCRAHQSDNSKAGAHSSNITNLLEMEDGRDLSFLGSKEKLLQKLKKYLVTALDKFLKRKITSHEKNVLTDLKNKINVASSAKELIPIVETAENVTQRFKEYSL